MELCVPVYNTFHEAEGTFTDLFNLFKTKPPYTGSLVRFHGTVL